MTAELMEDVIIAAEVAEFMGAEILITSSGMGVYRFYDDEGSVCEAGSIDRLDYGSSWDWLMPVVEKICEIYNQADEELRHAISRADLTIIYHTSILCHIEVVYPRVIEFIKWYKWYNEQK